MARLRERWPWLDVAVDVQGRYNELQGGVVAGSVTLSLFLSLFPLLLFGTALMGFFANRDTSFAASVVSNLGLTDKAAQTVTDAIAAAQRSRRTATVIGLVGLLWSGLGAVSAMQVAVDRAWQAKGRGLRDKASALLWLLGVVVFLTLSLAATALVLLVLPGWATPLGFVLSAAGYIGLFWWTFQVLGSPEVGWRPLLPGAIAGGLGFVALTTIGAWVVPRTIATSSALYGSIGVVFAMLAWLFFFGRLLVYSSVLNVVLYERRRGTVTVEVEVPKVAGQVPLTATRGGVVDEAATAS